MLESLQNPGIEDYPYDTEEPIVVIEPQDSQNIYEYANDIPAQYFDQMLPYAGKEQQQQQHPLEKREAISSYNLVLRPTEEQQDQANLYNLINQPDREEYIVPDTFENLYNTNAQLYEPFDDAYVPEYRELSENDANDNLEDEEDIDWSAMNAEEDLRPKDKRHSFMQDIYSGEEDESDSDDAKDISNYDFDYEDSSAAKDDDDDDILYYNNESGEPMFFNNKNEPIPVESVFDRRERLDVKKPGPFFAHRWFFTMIKMLILLWTARTTSSLTNSSRRTLTTTLTTKTTLRRMAKVRSFSSKMTSLSSSGSGGKAGQTEYEQPLSQQTRAKKTSDTVFTIKVNIDIITITITIIITIAIFITITIVITIVIIIAMMITIRSQEARTTLLPSTTTVLASKLR